MTFAAFEARLKRPSGLFAMTLVAMASVGIVRALMYWHGLPGWDDAAHVYKVFLLREGQGIFWDGFWYGGGYGAITYGFLYYWMAQYIPGPVLVALASGLLPLFFLLYSPPAPGAPTTCGRPGSSSPSSACTRPTARIRSSSASASRWPGSPCWPRHASPSGRSSSAPRSSPTRSHCSSSACSSG